MPTHRIRLHGFWTATEPSPGRVRHARRFGRPRTLDPDERAWLVCGGGGGPAAVSLNGELLGPTAGDGSFAFDVTPLLRPRNELWIDGPAGDVVLEIRSGSTLS